MINEMIDKFINMFTNHHINTKLQSVSMYTSISEDMQRCARYQERTYKKPRKSAVHSRLLAGREFYSTKTKTKLTMQRDEA
ncbi:hypothetical protein [Candidatus Endomicrobiellum agilis]|jgi:hypothetical protein|uniref:hypothetical protein n=1 Tax=Candidatus Endomicrobiellum agilis TaxID=3238957 RepID=UPI0035746B1C|nr:hypothetical protein [Endomicrobium sp.]